MSVYEDKSYEKMPTSHESAPAYYGQTQYYGESTDTTKAAPTQQATGAPLDTRSAPTDVAAHKQQLSKAAQEACSIAQGTNQDVQQRIEATLNGGNLVTKVVSIGACMTLADLNQGKRIEFPSDAVMSVFQVHPRNSTARDIRVGDARSVYISRAHLYSSFVEGMMPVDVSSDQMRGKCYPLEFGTGRRSGRAHRFLMTLYPGAHHYGTKKVVFQREKKDLFFMSQQQANFDVDEVENELREMPPKPVPAGQQLGHPIIVAPSRNMVALMIKTNQNKWRLDMKNFPEVPEHGVMLIPKPMSLMVLAMLRSVKAGVHKERVDLSVLSFVARSACEDSMGAKMVSLDTKLYMKWHMYIEYMFADPASLNA